MKKLKAIVTYRCPRCGVGYLFAKPFKLSKPLNMHKRCRFCSLNFEPEPGFYFGALFISYILSTLGLLGLALILVFGFHISLELTMLVIIALGVGFYVKLLRLSRSVWIHINIKYDRSFAKEN